MKQTMGAFLIIAALWAFIGHALYTSFHKLPMFGTLSVANVVTVAFVGLVLAGLYLIYK